MPSHVTADLSAATIALDRDELRERMSGNLCRCGAHNGIVDAILEIYARATEAGGMTPFTYRARRRRRRGAPPRAARRAPGISAAAPIWST